MGVERISTAGDGGTDGEGITMLIAGRNNDCCENEDRRRCSPLNGVISFVGTTGRGIM